MANRLSEAHTLFDRNDEVTEVNPVPKGKLPSYMADHRKRLRERFMVGGTTPLPDYEILELVLFRALSRQDTKPLAWRLLDRFGSFSHVISAPVNLLEEVEGVGPAVVTELKIIEAAAHRLARSRVLKKPALTGWDALLEYCRTAMSHGEIEQFRILFLDNKNILIADEEQATGTINHVPVYPREIMKRALELNASSIILVHNHPSGDPTPSQSDIDMTSQIERAADSLNIRVHDHIIIGKSRELSFRSEGLI